MAETSGRTTVHLINPLFSSDNYPSDLYAKVIPSLVYRANGLSKDNEKVYLNLLSSILKEGDKKPSRTGIGTLSLFGAQATYDLRKGFPLLTTKKLPWRIIEEEVRWFLRGETNIRSLQERNVHIWDEWADSNGDLGPVYGAMWRRFPGVEPGTTVDQLGDLLSAIVHSEYKDIGDRRMVISAWHPGLLPDTSRSFSENVASGKQALPPCHTLFQFNTTHVPFKDAMQYFSAKRRAANPGGASVIRGLSMSGITEETYLPYLSAKGFPVRYMDLKLYQRSGDMFLGVPFNIASYSLLLSLVAVASNCIPRFFIHSLGDAHIYDNHLNQVKTQLSRSPLVPPTLSVTPRALHLYVNHDSNPEVPPQVTLNGYTFHDTIPAPVAV